MAGRTPAELLTAVADLTASINDAPLDDLEVEDEYYPAERIKDYESATIESGFRLYRLLARHRESGVLAGHTIVTVDAESPQLAHQDDTSVVRAHRGHRLGLLLKAGMMLWLAEAEPQIDVDRHRERGVQRPHDPGQRPTRLPRDGSRAVLPAQALGGAVRPAGSPYDAETRPPASPPGRTAPRRSAGRRSHRPPDRCASTPAPVSPSTRPAFSIIGVFAARVIWASVRPCSLRIARPSSASWRQDIPLIRLNSSVRRAVGASRLSGAGLLDLLDEVGAQHPVRHAVDLGGHHGPVEVGLEVALLHGVGDGRVLGQQEARSTSRVISRRFGMPAPVAQRGQGGPPAGRSGRSTPHRARGCRARSARRRTSLRRAGWPR